MFTHLRSFRNLQVSKLSHIVMVQHVTIHNHKLKGWTNNSWYNMHLWWIWANSSMQPFRVQVPHSHCSLREVCKVFQKLRPKNSTLQDNFWLLFLFNICYWNPNLEFKSKKIFYYCTGLCVFQQRKFPNPMSKTQVSFVNEAPGLIIPSHGHQAKDNKMEISHM
jgi:hypothetical protein